MIDTTNRIDNALCKICQNTGQRKPVFWHILRSVVFDVYEDDSLRKQTRAGRGDGDSFNICLTLQCLMSTERSHILKQTCNFQLQVCLSMCGILVDIRHQRVKHTKKKHALRGNLCKTTLFGLVANKFVAIAKDLFEMTSRG